ncbi:uncharacterized protein LOC6542596 [Drosophila erecta]|uniref:Uncharacterized protein n=1 Tax=Drosophila erecta TaxID=7220 RepID=B3N972_DROER|nr:uncharacterized protein LOC6542596 [Drosophila erecta]XP_026834459.1 uncharacterized protein LOC6542596 [Drosophila erecta]XP_026834460.1 uncharacterized protein LOC6542596 [Drosophila erecta]EDV58507.1 uncharacterized protein Dere_GG23947 [Drosophila erecta]
MSWNKRNTSHISIYNYPEHLNPFYEDDNHKRLRFFGFSKKKNENGRHSLSIGNLQELWKSYSFRKKKSSTLGINKTSESPPTLRRDLNDNSYLNSRVFRGDRHTSLQDIDRRRESDSLSSNGMFFNRNDMYRSTTQFSGYRSPNNQSTRLSQSSLASSNPFESQPESCPSSPMSSRRYRKKRRAPPPPKLVVQDYLATKDIESLASEIDAFVNNRKESLIKQEVGEEVPKSNEPTILITAPISDIEPNPSTSKAPQTIRVKQSNGYSTANDKEKVTISESDNNTNTCTSPTPKCNGAVHIKQINKPEIPSTPVQIRKVRTTNTAGQPNHCTSKTPECIASIHIKHSSEHISVCSEQKPNNDVNQVNKKPNGTLPVGITEETLVVKEASRPAELAKMTKQSVALVDSEDSSGASTSKTQHPIANDQVKLPVEALTLSTDAEPEDNVYVEERKTNSFGTVKQISQIFEENITSSSGPSQLPKKEVINTNGAISKRTENHVVYNLIQPMPAETSDVLQIREEFELENNVRYGERPTNDRNRSSISTERESNSTPTPRMRKKKSIKEVLESISRNQKILNESAAKGTKVYLTPSYADNKYNYPNELNNVNNRSSKEVTSANISVSTSDTNELPSQSNLFISKISKFKGQFRESSPTSSNLDWNPLPKPSRAHNSASSNFNNGSC